MKTFTAAFIAFAAMGVTMAFADARADRQALMRANNTAMSGINSIILGVLDLNSIKSQVQVLVDNGGKISALFAPDSDHNDAGVMPVLWTDQAGFKAAADKLVADAKKVPAGFPDRLAMVLAMKDVQADCAGCHKTYRAAPAVDPNGRGGRRGAAAAAAAPPPDADAAVDKVK